MLNSIWLAFLLIAVIVGGFAGHLPEMTKGALDTAQNAVMKIALPLMGIWAIWLGMMRLAEQSGLVQVLARALRPLMRRLFPEVPPEHPAMGAMILNMAANMLGLGNAATPLGLRAMAHLERLNPLPGTATNAMCTFLAINTASIQLVPTTAVAILAVAGSKNPTAIIPSAFLATLCAACSGVTAAKLLERLPMFALPKGAASKGDPSEPAGQEVAGSLENKREPATPGGSGMSEKKVPAASSAAAATETPRDAAPSAKSEPKAEEGQALEKVSAPPLSGRGKLALCVYFAAMLAIFLLQAVPEVRKAVLHEAPPELARAAYSGALWHEAVAAPTINSALLSVAFTPLTPAPGLIVRALDAVAILAIPFMLSFFPLYAALRGVRVFDQFVDGAKEAFDTARRVIPFLVGMLVAISLLRDAGVIARFTDLLRPILSALRFPPDLVPMVLMRPLSGSATQGIFVELVNRLGPDSLVSRIAATVYGSTETTFYVLAVYFGSVSIRQTRHAIVAGLTADAVAVIASIAICRLLFA